MFEKYIKLYLQDLDVDKYIADQRANEKDDALRLKTETGEINDNVWDQNQGDHSKKDNASKNAKLFFFSIPDTRWVIVKNEETGELTREVEEITDPIFGLSQPVPFSIAWNKVLENLWDIDNMDQMISRCATLGETDSFFKQIHQRLTDPDNPLPEQVLTQLENTSLKYTKECLMNKCKKKEKLLKNVVFGKFWIVTILERFKDILRIGHWHSSHLIMLLLILTVLVQSIILLGNIFKQK